MLTWPKMHWGYWKVRFLLSWRRIPFQGCRKPSGFGARAKSEPGGSRPSHWTSMTWSTPAKAQQPIKIINKYQFLMKLCKKQVFKRTVQLARVFWVVFVGAHRAGELSFRRTQWYLGVIESNSGQKSVRLTGNKESALYISRIQLRTLASPKDETSMFIFITEY